MSKKDIDYNETLANAYKTLLLWGAFILVGWVIMAYNRSIRIIPVQPTQILFLLGSAIAAGPLIPKVFLGGIGALFGGIF